ncbi:MAG: hypothetical protein ACOC5B_01235, partial [Myxococcota bacterium]
PNPFSAVMVAAGLAMAAAGCRPSPTDPNEPPIEPQAPTRGGSQDDAPSDWDGPAPHAPDAPSGD